MPASIEARPQRSGFKKPGTHTKAEIRAAGEAIARGEATTEQEAIVQDWRDCHEYVLNSFQINLRRWIRGRHIVLVQRQKRLSTVRDKLVSGRAKDVSTMNDLAGCRLIFPTVAELVAFRDEYHTGTRSSHEYVSEGKYDYLKSPKNTGYRGMHDVFKYNVAGEPGNAWNGLRVEVQYRTQAQHAWATAVEISDIIDGQRVKFERGVNVARERLFVLASEYIARSEGYSGAAPNVSNEDLLTEMLNLEQQLGVIARLRALHAGAVQVPNARNLVLVFTDHLEVLSFKSAKQAIEKRNQIEIDNPALDVVYVRAEKPAEVAGAFRNYWRDARLFIDLLPDLEAEIARRLGEQELADF